MRSLVLSRARKADYPGVFQEIGELIGEAATAKLVAQYGGCTPVYIPGKLKPEHSLCKLLGQEAAQCLADEFGGLSVAIPRAVALQIEQRNRLILADCAEGMTQSMVARKYQLTTRTIRKITNS